MFGLGLPEIVVILFILFFIFGAKRLPVIGEGLGKTIKELRKIRDERKAEKGKEEKDQKEDLISDLRKEVNDIPGLQEAREIKEAADQIKRLTKLIR
jgi:TatA/E family protein of Tat protein translocase